MLFDQLLVITQEQLYSTEKYFDFNSLIEKERYLEDWALFFILCLLLYSWYQLFAWFDRK